MIKKVLLVGCVALLVRCASQASSPKPPPPSPESTVPDRAGTQAVMSDGMMGGGMMGGGMSQMCPMKVEGTTVRAEDLEAGVALVFTTQGDVAEVRRRVAHMAEMHSHHHGGGHGHMMAMNMAPMPASDTSSEEIEGGARLVFKAKNPSDVPALREHAHEHANEMASGACPMMSKHARTTDAHEHGAPRE